MRKSRNIKNSLHPIWGLILFLALWELGVALYGIPPWLLPAPSQVLATMLDVREMLGYHSISTLVEDIYGFGLSISLALIMGLVLDSSSWLKKAIYPILVISQTIPLIVLAALLPLWFGWGLLPKILIVTLVCFFPITINLLQGLTSIDEEQLKLFKSMGASPWQTFRMVKFPAALPGFFAGLKISATYSIMAAVISEWVGAQRGLGFFMTIQQKSFAIDKVLAAVLIICILSLLLVKLVELIEYLLIPWNRSSLEETQH
jgi:ABC-type nitrate/sulfonate/bicarbonate transport system permease component